MSRGRAGAAAGHLGADRLQLGHDLAVHRTEIAFGRDRHRHFVDESFLDAKALAMNRHEISPEPV